MRGRVNPAAACPPRPPPNPQNTLVARASCPGRHGLKARAIALRVGEGFEQRGQESLVAKNRFAPTTSLPGAHWPL